MSNSKAAGTLTMGFNGKMSLALAKDIESHQNERDRAMTARGLVLDRLRSRRLDPRRSSLVVLSLGNGSSRGSPWRYTIRLASIGT